MFVYVYVGGSVLKGDVSELRYTNGMGERGLIRYREAGVEKGRDKVCSWQGR